MNLFRDNHPFKAFTLWLILIAVTFLGVPVQANPTGGVVVHGNISFNQVSPGNLQINQASQMAIINWQDFSINANELTQFNQPNSSAAVLNRVTSGAISQIQGQLKANGSVFVINPNGVFISASGVIDTGGMSLISTLDIDDSDFLDGGTNRFYGDSLTGVQNFGTISSTGGDVVLLGGFVENGGTIGALNGTVALGSGGDIILEQAGGSTITVRGASDYEGTGVTNTGDISGAAVEMKAHGNVYALAINNTGAVRASGATRSNGRVRLHARGSSSNINLGGTSNISAVREYDGGDISVQSEGGSVVVGGVLSASGQTDGGSVEVLGNSVSISDSAVIDADGSMAGGTVSVDAVESLLVAGEVTATGQYGAGGNVDLTGRTIELGETASVLADGFSEGGSVRIGGEFQGVDGVLREADTLVADLGSRISAQGTMGDGGTVIIWSNFDTIFHGEVNASAVGGIGDGGFIEVSGKESLTLDGVLNASSETGKSGSILLDPGDISVGETGADVLNSTVNNALQGGTNFFITTQDGTITFEEPGDGGFDNDDNINNRHDAIQWTNDDASFGAFAGKNIIIKNHIRTSGKGSVNLIAGWTGLEGDSELSLDPQDAWDSYLQNGEFGAGGGSIQVGDRNIRGHVEVGSRFGDTNVAGFQITLQGSDANDVQRHALIGFFDNGATFAPGLRKAGTNDFQLDMVDDTVLVNYTDANGDPQTAPAWLLSSGLNYSNQAFRENFQQVSGVNDPIVGITGQHEVDINGDGVVDGVRGVNSTGVMHETFIPYASHYNSSNTGNWWWQQIEAEATNAYVGKVQYDGPGGIQGTGAQLVAVAGSSEATGGFGALRPEFGAGLATDLANINVIARGNVVLNGGSGREENFAQIGHGGTTQNSWEGAGVSIRETLSRTNDTVRDQMLTQWSINGSTSDRNATSIARLAPVHGNINVFAGVDPSSAVTVNHRNGVASAQFGSTGDIRLTGNQAFETGSQSNNSPVHIGHGGVGQFGEFFGDIHVQAGRTVDLKAGTATRNFATIGHVTGGHAYWNPTSNVDQQIRFFATAGDFDNPNLRRGELFSGVSSTGFVRERDPLSQDGGLFIGLSHGLTQQVTIESQVRSGIIRLEGDGVTNLRDLITAWNGDPANADAQITTVTGTAEFDQTLDAGALIQFTSERYRRSQDYLPSVKEHFIGTVPIEGGGISSEVVIVAAGFPTFTSQPIELVGNGTTSLGDLITAWNSVGGRLNEDMITATGDTSFLVANGQEITFTREHPGGGLEYSSATGFNTVTREATGGTAIAIAERLPEHYTRGTSGRGNSASDLALGTVLSSAVLDGPGGVAPINLAPTSTGIGANNIVVEALDGSTITGFHGDITVIAGTGDVNIKAGVSPADQGQTRDRRFAGIGHGGSSFGFGAEGSGYLNVDSINVGNNDGPSATNLGLDGREFVQWRVGAGDEGNTNLRTYQSGGSSRNSNLQAMTITGDIAVTAGRDIILNAGNDVYDDAYIGHGGATLTSNESSSFVLGDISVNAGGNLSLTGGGEVFNNSNRGNGGGDNLRAAARLGHGGYQSGFTYFGGDIEAVAGGDVTVTGGAYAYSSAKIGHQSTDSRAQVGGDFSRTENTFRDFNSLDIVSTITADAATVTYTNNYDANVQGDFATENTLASNRILNFTDRSFALSTGGAAGTAIGDRNTANISVTAGGDITLNHLEIGAQIGDRRAFTNGRGDSITQELNGLRVNNSFSQIGHGGILTDAFNETNTSSNYADKVGNIFVEAIAGDIIMQNGDGEHRWTRIGHGVGANDQVTSAVGGESRAVELGGNITVVSSGDVLVDASSASDINDFREATLRLTGNDFSVYDVGGLGQASSPVFGANPSRWNPVVIGHGGITNNRDIVVLGAGSSINGIDVDSNISVQANGDVSVLGGQGIEASFAQIGHGFGSDQGDDTAQRNGIATGFTGDIDVRVLGDLLVKGSDNAWTQAPGSLEGEFLSVTGAYAAIGNGGYQIDAPANGDIKIYVGNDLDVRAQARTDLATSVIGTSGGYKLQHRDVASGLAPFAASAFNFAKIGHVNAENENRRSDIGDSVGESAHEGDITVVVQNDFNLIGGQTPDIDGQIIYGAFAQVGHGGPGVDGRLDGAVTVLVGNDLNVVGGTDKSGTTAPNPTLVREPNNYTMIGHGDRIFDPNPLSTSALFRGEGEGVRVGDIVIAVGEDADFSDVLIGHTDPLVSSQTNLGDTQVAVSRNNPFFGGSGSLTTSGDTVFTSGLYGNGSQLEFYLPSRSANLMSAETRINEGTETFDVPLDDFVGLSAAGGSTPGRADEVYLTPDLWWDASGLAAAEGIIGGDVFPTSASAGQGGSVANVSNPGGLPNLDSLTAGALGSSAILYRDDNGISGAGNYTIYYDAVEFVGPPLPPVVTPLPTPPLVFRDFDFPLFFLFDQYDLFEREEPEGDEGLYGSVGLFESEEGSHDEIGLMNLEEGLDSVFGNRKDRFSESELDEEERRRRERAGRKVGPLGTTSFVFFPGTSRYSSLRIFGAPEQGY